MRRDNGLTMARYDVLAHLDMAGGRLGLTELAASILLSQSGLSKLLDRMETAGLVRRDPDPRDARAAFAAIPHGLKTALSGELPFLAGMARPRLGHVGPRPQIASAVGPARCCSSRRNRSPPKSDSRAMG